MWGLTHIWLWIMKPKWFMGYLDHNIWIKCEFWSLILGEILLNDLFFRNILQKKKYCFKTIEENSFLLELVYVPIETRFLKRRVPKKNLKFWDIKVKLTKKAKCLNSFQIIYFCKIIFKIILLRKKFRILVSMCKFWLNYRL